MTPYTDLTIDQLRSCLEQRDDQLRVALADLKYVKEELDGRTGAMFKERQYAEQLKAERDAAQSELASCCEDRDARKGELEVASAQLTGAKQLQPKDEL